MGPGLLAAAAILVLFPLAAVWAAGRWRDPPRERWGIPAERRAAAANTAELTEFRFRQRLGLLDERTWTAARKAVSRGVAAPPQLRPATRELAERRVAELDRQIAAVRPLPVRILALVAGWAAGVYLAVHGLVFPIVYAAAGSVLTVARTEWWLRRVRERAVAAVAANA